MTPAGRAEWRRRAIRSYLDGSSLAIPAFLLPREDDQFAAVLACLVGVPATDVPAYQRALSVALSCVMALTAGMRSGPHYQALMGEVAVRLGDDFAWSLHYWRREAPLEGA